MGVFFAASIPFAKQYQTTVIVCVVVVKELIKVADYQIKAQARTVTGKKVKQLRQEGITPIVVYGRKIDSMALQANTKELELTLRDAGGTNLIDLNVDGETYNVIARDVQRDVVKRNILHADFVAIDETARITAEVPIILEGVSPVVASRKGILITGPNTLTVEMLAVNMIDSISVDLTVLQELGDSIYVKDMEVDETVTILNDPEQMVARVSQTSAARREEALATVAELEGLTEEADVSAVEVAGEEDEDEFEEEEI